MTYSSENRYKKARKLGYEEAKLKVASFCAYQDRYQQEVRDKLYSYGLIPPDVEELLSYLISEGFVNEERFAKSFAGGRFRLKKWGKSKIENELVRRKISQYCIKKGLKEIDDKEYFKTINTLISRKSEAIFEQNPFKFKKRLAAYLIRKGFESELVWDILNDKITGGITEDNFSDGTK